jgi:hypothetical protein
VLDRRALEQRLVARTRCERAAVPQLEPVDGGILIGKEDEERVDDLPVSLDGPRHE